MYFFKYFNILHGDSPQVQFIGIVTDNQKKLIEQSRFKCIRIINDSAQFFKAFAIDHTITSFYKYKWESSPSNRNKYGHFTLGEFRGTFNVNQYKFRWYGNEVEMEVEDTETGTLVDGNASLTNYKKRN